MNDIRRRRVESLIREKISTLIMLGILKDPRVDSSIALTQVKVSKDLTSARIWVSSFGGETATMRAVQGLAHAAGFIQSRIGQEIRFRNTPRLYFVSDKSVRESLEVNRLIDQVMKNSHSE